MGSCIVYDTDNMCMFGYITSDIDNLQRCSHVFSAESKDKASEILTAICKGYKEGMKLPQGKEITPSKTGTQKKKEGATKQKARRDISDKKTSSSKEHRSSKSDHLVSRMKNFFQGGESQRSYSISHNSKAAEARRKRGGSMDNLIDSVEGDASTI